MAQLLQLKQGIWLSEGRVAAKRVKRIGKRGQSTLLEIVLAEGKNREIRRMLAKQGHKVMRLKRVAIGPIHLGRLKAGKSRRLSLPELQTLRRIAFRPKSARAEQ
jgi:23S rRNA pseudouridine2605 synthase